MWKVKVCKFCLVWERMSCAQNQVWSIQIGLRGETRVTVLVVKEKVTLGNRSKALWPFH